MTNSTRGYDDTHELMEMAVGIFDGRFKSVEHAARSVLPDASQSNIDRLRRKFRQQAWIDKGRQEFLRRAAAPTETPDDDYPPASFADYIRAIGIRIRHPRATLRSIFSKDAIWEAPYIPSTFLAFCLAFPPIIPGCIALVIGRQLPEDFSLWQIPAFSLLSLLPLSFCLLALEAYEGFPNLLPEDHGHQDDETLKHHLPT
jgi:hypothetical protein